MNVEYVVCLFGLKLNKLEMMLFHVSMTMWSGLEDGKYFGWLVRLSDIQNIP